MTLVQMPIDVPHGGEHRFGRYNPGLQLQNHHNYSAAALENLAALLSSSTTTSGTFSYLDEPDIPSSCRVVVGLGSDSKVVKKARSFPKVKYDDPNKAKSCMRENERRITRSKSVRFADTQGLPLVNVHRLTSDDPSYTKNEIVPYGDDVFHCRASNKNGLFNIPSTPTADLPKAAAAANMPPVPQRTFNFQQPSSEPGFHRRVREQNVCLQNVKSERRSILGTIQVTNLAFTKQVSVRWTHDCWRTFHESSATYCSGDGQIDKFSFELPANGDDIEFAICYAVDRREYWDNNRGKNYIVFGSNR